MTQAKPDTITVLAKVKEELDADQADIQVSIVGSSLFSGEEAFKKAEEVKLLTNELMEAGVEECNIKLRNVEVDSGSFAMLKNSSAKYTLRIAKIPLEKLPAILGIIGSQKKCTMNWLEWVYHRSEEVRKKLRTEALKKAIEVARNDAEVLGVNILGVYDVSEESVDDSNNRTYTGNDDLFAAKAVRSRSVDLGFALGNVTVVKVSLRVEFRVSGMSSN